MKVTLLLPATLQLLLLQKAHSFHSFLTPRSVPSPQTTFLRLYKDTEAEAPFTPPTTAKPTQLISHGPEEDHGDRALRLLSSELGVKSLQGTLEECDKITPIPLVLIERTLDTAEDAYLHLRRIPYDLGWRPLPKVERKTVVVLGSGWAAHAFMKVADTEKLRVIVVSPTNHFVFTPMLAGAAVGTVEYRSMTEAVRAANPTIEEFVEGEAVDVDLENKVVKVKLNSLLEDVTEGAPPIIDVPYDTLVTAVGVRSANIRVPGASKCLTLKTCEDARKLRVNIGESFEYASRPDAAGEPEEQIRERARRVTFLIVGGGPTGVELAGELSDFIKDITRPRVGAYPRLEGIAKVILVQSGPELLPAFEEKLRDEGLKALQRRGIEVRLNTKTIEVGEGFVKLLSEVTNEEEVVPVGLTVWCAGTSPQSFTNTLRGKLSESARGPGGRINVDQWMRAITDDPNVFGSVVVLGDSACFKDKRKDVVGGGMEATLIPQFLPQTAQVAGQQGAYAARLLSRGYNLTVSPPMLLETKSFNRTSEYLLNKWLHLRSLDVAAPFIFVNLGLLAYVGGGEALSQVQLGNIPLFTYAGSVAFMLWRSVYLVKQVATRNRVLVTFDWVKSYLFGRDVTRL